MTDGRMLFYGVIFAMLCFTSMVTHCTYQVASCKKEAIKNNVPVENIRSLCHIG